MGRTNEPRVRELAGRGHTVGEICLLTGNTQTQVRRVLSKYGVTAITVEERGDVQHNGIGLVNCFPRRPRVSDQARAQIRDLAAEGLPGTEIASIVPLNINSIRRHRGAPALTRQELGSISLMQRRMETL